MWASRNAGPESLPEGALMDSRLSPILGLSPHVPPSFYFPVPVLVMEWPWSRPLPAILTHGGWTIDDVVSDPRVAALVRIQWRLLKASERLARERERQNSIKEQLWWRRQGLPVACPICGKRGECSCKEARIAQRIS